MKKLSEIYKELGIAFTFPIKIKDSNGNVTYFEKSNGFWYRRKRDATGNETYFEDSDGYWCRREYDANGNETYYETYYESSDGYWRKKEYDAKGNETYYEDSKCIRSNQINRAKKTLTQAKNNIK